MKDGRAVHLYSTAARVAYCGAWATLLVATLGGVVDPTAGPDEVEIFPGALFLGLEALLITRSARIGLVIDDHNVTSRAIVRTRTFPRESVSRVNTTGYSGIVYAGATSRWLLMLRLRVDEGSVELPHIVGPPHAIRRLSDRVQATLGLPRRTPPA